MVYAVLRLCVAASGRKSVQRYSRSNTTLVVIATLTYRRDYTENPNAMTTPAA